MIPSALPVALAAEAPLEIGANSREGPPHLRDVPAVVVRHAGLVIRDGDRLLQPLEHVAVAAQDVVGLDPHRAAGDLGRHARMPVAIAADPGPPAQIRLRDGVGIGPADGVLQCPVQPRRDGEERLVEEDHRGPNLVERGRPLGADRAGLPEQADLLAKPAAQVAVLRSGQSRIVEPIEEPIQPPLRHQHRPAPCLRGMRGEDGHEAHTVGERAHVLARHAVASEAEDGGADPIGQWRPSARSLALPQRAEPMLLLRQVDQQEVGGEGARDGEQLGCGPAVESVERPLDRLLRAGAAAADGGAAQLLHELEELRALLLHDDLAQQGAEELDLAGQGIPRAGAADATWLGASRGIARVPFRVTGETPGSAGCFGEASGRVMRPLGAIDDAASRIPISSSGEVPPGAVVVHLEAAAARHARHRHQPSLAHRVQREVAPRRGGWFDELHDSERTRGPRRGQRRIGSGWVAAWL